MVRPANLLDHIESIRVHEGSASFPHLPQDSGSRSRVGNARSALSACIPKSGRLKPRSRKGVGSIDRFDNVIYGHEQCRWISPLELSLWPSGL